MAPALGVDPKHTAPVCCFRIRQCTICRRRLRGDAPARKIVQRSLTPCAVAEAQCTIFAGQALPVAEELLMRCAWVEGISESVTHDVDAQHRDGDH